MPVGEAEHPLSHRQPRRAIAEGGDHSGQLVPGDRRCSVTVEAIGPGRGPRHLSRDESRRMNLNDDVVDRCRRLGPLHQRHPGRSRSLVRHHDRLHGNRLLGHLSLWRIAGRFITRGSRCMALKQIAGRVAIKMPRLSGIRTCDCDQGPRNSKLERWTPSSTRSATALDGRPRRGAESSERHVVAPTGRWRAMLRAYPQARLVGYSRFESRSGRSARGSALPARCADGYLGRANPDCRAGCDRAAGLALAPQPLGREPRAALRRSVPPRVEVACRPEASR